MFSSDLHHLGNNGRSDRLPVIVEAQRAQPPSPASQGASIFIHIPSIILLIERDSRADDSCQWEEHSNPFRH